MIGNARVRVLVLASAALLAGAHEASSYPRDVVRCRDSVIKAATAHAVEMIEVLSDCHAARLGGSIPAATDCNDIAAAAAALGVAFADSVFESNPDGPSGRCEGLAPADALYTSCPAPCDSIVPDGWPTVDACLACVTRSRVEQFGSGALGLSPLPLSAGDSACASALVDVGARIVPTILRDSQRCEKRVGRPNYCNYRQRRPGKTPKARAKAMPPVAANCGDADFSAIAGCPTALSDAGCVLAQALVTGEQLAHDVARLQDLRLPMSAADFTTIVFGSRVCGLRGDGTLDCWGSDGGVQDYGVFGRFTRISSWGGELCGIRDDGSIDCFSGGFLVVGQEVIDPPTGTFTKISVGSGHICALDTAGEATCWGNDYWGESSPPAGSFTSVSAGGSHSCGLRADGSIECWGSNTYGESTVPPGTYVQLATDHSFTCGLRLDGTLACWGWADGGQTTPPAGPFLRIPDRMSSWNDNCAIRADSTIECWGTASPGEPPPAGPFENIFSDGSGNFCALRADGSLACWGRSYWDVRDVPEGSLAQISTGLGWWDPYFCHRRTDGSAVCGGKDEEGSLDEPAGPFVHVEAGDGFACGLRADGSIECWGANDFGQALPPSGTFAQVSVGDDHACGLRTDASIQCWGHPSSGIAAPPGAFAQVSAGSGQSCAIDVAGEAECWGYAPYGRSPAPGSDGYAAISAKGAPCAIRLDGQVECWGPRPARGEFTQVTGYCGLRSDGSVECWSPRWIPGGVYTSIDDGWFCALREDGYKVCWE